MTCKKASEIKVGEKLNRFQHWLEVKSVTPKRHALGRQVVEVVHEKGTVNFMPNHKVIVQ